MRVIFNGRHQSGCLDLEATEMVVRSVMHQAGAAVLTRLLCFASPAADQRTIGCACGRQAHYREQRSKPVLTVVGKVEISRPYYLCSHCHTGQFPADTELDVENTEFSPGVRRMQAMVGQEAPFDHGREQMLVLAGLEVTAKSVERTAEAIGADIAAGEQHEVRKAVQLDLPVIVGEPIPILYVQMDGTGVPVVKKETEGRKGKKDGQPAHTREVKLGCVFTQATWDKEGYAIRDPGSTTYTGSIETAEEFGKRIYVEAWTRGWSRAKKKVVLGDGAEWIWNLAELHFPGAVQIVDLYHARQHLSELARKLHPGDTLSRNAWMKVHQKRLLDKGKIEKLVLSLRSTESTNPEVLEKLRTEADYFERNAKRMRYPKFRRQHLFVGSGVIEAGCKTVIGSRLKKSGMFWTVAGPTPSSLCGAVTSTAALRTTGRADERLDLHFEVAHPLVRQSGLRWAGLIAGVLALWLSYGSNGAPYITNDGYQYLDAASNLVAGKCFCTRVALFDEQVAFGHFPIPFTHFAPGYPLLIAAVSRTGVAGPVAGYLLSALGFLMTIWLIQDIALALGATSWVVALFSLIWITDATALLYASMVATESLFTVSLLALVALIVRGVRSRAARPFLPVAIGVVAGVSYWIRYPGLFLVGGAGIYLIARAWRVPGGRRGALAGLVAVAALVAPIQIRNVVYTGSWRGGFNGGASASPLSVVAGTVRVFFHLVAGDRVRAHFDIWVVIFLLSAALVVFLNLRARSAARPAEDIRGSGMGWPFL